MVTVDEQFMSFGLLHHFGGLLICMLTCSMFAVAEFACFVLFLTSILNVFIVFFLHIILKDVTA